MNLTDRVDTVGDPLFLFQISKSSAITFKKSKLQANGFVYIRFYVNFVVIKARAEIWSCLWTIATGNSLRRCGCLYIRHSQLLISVPVTRR